jgi:cytochrome c5
MRRYLVLAFAVPLTACLRPAATSSVAPVPEPSPNGLVESARLAYERACAGCHEDGLGGAPRTRHPEDWLGRSRLWQAVLTERAKRGYLGMPAKGGEPELSDREVQAAAEYMLSITHPTNPAG